MAKTGDVQMNYNANASTTYQYMLSLNSENQKAWQVQQLFTQPPSLLKNELTMTIKAGPKLRLADGSANSAVMDIANVMTQLRILTDSKTEINVNGYDNRTYKVLFDQTATRVRARFDETGRIAEYDIDLKCYDRHQ